MCHVRRRDDGDDGRRRLRRQRLAEVGRHHADATAQLALPPAALVFLQYDHNVAFDGDLYDVFFFKKKPPKTSLILQRKKNRRPTGLER